MQGVPRDGVVPADELNKAQNVGGIAGRDMAMWKERGMPGGGHVPAAGTSVGDESIPYGPDGTRVAGAGTMDGDRHAVGGTGRRAGGLHAAQRRVRGQHDPVVALERGGKPMMGEEGQAGGGSAGGTDDMAGMHHERHRTRVASGDSLRQQ